MTFDLLWLRDVVHAQPAWLVFVAVSVAFAAIYFGSAAVTWWLTRHVLPARGIGRIIDRRPLRAGQIPDEIRRSLVSILVFAGYGVLTVAADRAGVVAIRWVETPSLFLLDLLLLTLWNEVHFYLCHRLLHTKWLYRHVHLAHHRSLVATPFSTYSFHWFEAIMLSSVMILLLLVYPLGIGAVVVFPLISLALNSIGHMNYAVFPERTVNALFAGCRRHALHHAKNVGNYGFYLPWLDRLLGTRVPGVDPRAPLPPDDPA
jgi:sterol desaturase/sphingolipid hydroxylase (fatty acid hydroxylase superfamily)